tara:strand:- start:899 stop:2032 length:1134 start_codon:yes stop_codon:yes gene_type:complete
MPFISGDNILATLAVILFLAWFGFWADKTRLGKVTSGVVWIITIGILLSNLSITPYKSAIYDFIGQYMVSAAIPLLLLKADLRKVFRDSGRVMLPLVIAGAGVITGVLLGYFLLNLGEIGPKVAGVYTAGYIGGAMNFVAVAKSVNMSPAEFSAAISASSIVSVIGLMVLVAIPSIKLIQRLIPSNIMAQAETPSTEQEQDAVIEMNLLHLSGALALSFGICTAASLLADTLGLGQYNILFITLLTIAVANTFPRQLHLLKGEFELGMLFMYIFFAMVGLSTNMTTFLDHAIILLVYGLLIITVQFIVVLTMAKLLKIDLAEAITGSGAAIVGPAVTAAVVSSKGWNSMITPAVMTGIFGYVIANFIGVALTALLAG